MAFFLVLHYIDKQVCKLELLAKWKIYDVFHMSLLEQKTTIKRLVNKVNKLLEPEPEIEVKGNNKYKIEVICNSKVYIKKALRHLLRLYHLIF